MRKLVDRIPTPKSGAPEGAMRTATIEYKHCLFEWYFCSHLGGIPGY